MLLLTQISVLFDEEPMEILNDPSFTKLYKVQLVNTFSGRDQQG